MYGNTNSLSPTHTVCLVTVGQDCQPNSVSKSSYIVLTSADHNLIVLQLWCVPDIGPPAHGSTRGSDFTYSKEVFITCDEGYMVSNQDNFTKTVVRSCQHDGTWSERDVSCEGMYSDEQLIQRRPNETTDLHDDDIVLAGERQTLYL